MWLVATTWDNRTRIHSVSAHWDTTGWNLCLRQLWVFHYSSLSPCKTALNHSTHDWLSSPFPGAFIKICPFSFCNPFTNKIAIATKRSFKAWTTFCLLSVSHVPWCRFLFSKFSFLPVGNIPIWYHTHSSSFSCLTLSLRSMALTPLCLKHPSMSSPCPSMNIAQQIQPLDQHNCPPFLCPELYCWALLEPTSRSSLQSVTPLAICIFNPPLSSASIPTASKYSQDSPFLRKW